MINLTWNQIAKVIAQKAKHNIENMIVYYMVSHVTLRFSFKNKCNVEIYIPCFAISPNLGFSIYC